MLGMVLHALHILLFNPHNDPMEQVPLSFSILIGGAEVQREM